MPLRINEITSDVHVSGEEKGLSTEAINGIVAIVMDRIREEQEHQNRILEECKIRDQASEIEPY